MAACAPLICFVPWTSASPSRWTPDGARGREAAGTGPRRAPGRGRSKDKASLRVGQPGKRRPLRSFSEARKDDLPELEASTHPAAALLFEEVERAVAKHHSELNSCFASWLRRYSGLSEQLPTLQEPAEAKEVDEGLKHTDVRLEVPHSLSNLSDDSPAPLCRAAERAAATGRAWAKQGTSACLDQPRGPQHHTQAPSAPHPSTAPHPHPPAATRHPSNATPQAAEAVAHERSGSVTQERSGSVTQERSGSPSHRTTGSGSARSTMVDATCAATVPPSAGPSTGASTRRIMGVHGVIEEVKRARSRRRRALKPFQELLASRIEDAHKAQTTLQRFFSSRAYDILSGLLIVLNSILIGLHTQINAESTLYKISHMDQRTQNGDEQVHSALLYAQAGFTLIFTLELGLRWLSEGLVHFFYDTDKWWNVFDIWVVGLSILDAVLEFAINEQAVLENISVLRVTRVVRVVRVARIIRIMKFFRELRMMIYSILGCTKSLLWVVVVLAMTFYVFGITFTAATSFELRTLDPDRVTETEDLRKSFGTVDKSLLSLFQAMSGGQDWGVFYDALGALATPYRYFFLLFILFAVFAVINIVTGVFVDSALASNTQDRDIIIHEELESKKAYLRSLRELFEEMDEDDSGSISLAEFESKLDDERVIAYFHALKLDVGDARTLFWLLDYDHSNAVNIDEFMEGCYSLQGEARSLDTKLMQQEVRCLREKFDMFHYMVTELQESMDVLLPEAVKPKLRRIKTTPAHWRGNSTGSLDSVVTVASDSNVVGMNTGHTR